MKNAARLAVLAALLAALAAGAPVAAGQTAAAAMPDRSKAPEPGPPAPLRLPSPQKLRLANGVPVFLIERHKVPLVQTIVVLRGGAPRTPPSGPASRASRLRFSSVEPARGPLSRSPTSPTSWARKSTRTPGGMRRRSE